MWSNHESITGLKQLAIHHPEAFPAEGAPLDQRLHFLEITMSGIHTNSASISQSQLRIICTSSRESLTTLSLVQLADAESFSALVSYLDEFTLPNVHTLFINDSKLHKSWRRLLSTLPGLRSLELKITDRMVDQRRIFAAVGKAASKTLRLLSFCFSVMFGKAVDSSLNEDIEGLEELCRIIRLPNLEGL